MCGRIGLWLAKDTFFFLIVRERKEGRLAIDADGFVAIVIGNEGALIL